jgi:hypothetical protein
VEGVLLPADCLHFLAGDATSPSRRTGELLESDANPVAFTRGQLLVGPLGGGRQTYLVGLAQPISSSGLLRPRR